MTEVLSYNGDIISRSSFRLSPENRAFRYGDGVFETIRVHSGHILWEDKHFDRLNRACEALQLKPPQPWTRKQFRQAVQQLFDANHKSGEAARIRFSLFRNEGGLYTPSTNQASFLIESQKLYHATFELNKKGLFIDCFDGITKPVNMLSPLKSINAQLYVLAGLYKQQHDLDDCLILNEHGNIAEAISSNVFIVSKDRLYTPSLREGCVQGIMRAVIMDVARDSHINVTETQITPTALDKADEIFLTNAIHGIRHVLGYKDKRYYNRMAVKLTQELNSLANAGK